MDKIKKYFNDLARDKRNGPLDVCAKCLLQVAAFFYALVIRVWDLLYKHGVLKSVRVPCVVVSVGNITLGGTGKTPFVMFLAGRLSSLNKRVVIISRGYGEDEYKMLETHMENVPLIVDKDRIRAALKARDAYQADMIILDDGFQHRRLARDIDIVVLDGANPIGNGCMFPRGILREPEGSLARATHIVINKGDMPERAAGVLAEKYVKKENISRSVYKPCHLIDVLTGEKSDAGVLNGKKICLVSGIADPAYFRYMASGLGGVIVHEIEYVDHCTYSAKDIESMISEAGRRGAEIILTTEKDRAKLINYLDNKYAAKILSLHIEIDVKDGHERLINDIVGSVSGAVR